MKKIALLAAGVIVLVLSCMRAEIKATRALEISDVPISTIPDGSYTGSFEYGGFTYSVRCVVSEGRVDKIKVLQNRDTPASKNAENIVERVIELQKVNVDAISGATTTSKALLKAIERALAKGASGGTR